MLNNCRCYRVGLGFPKPYSCDESDSVQEDAWAQKFCERERDSPLPHNHVTLMTLKHVAHFLFRVVARFLGIAVLVLQSRGEVNVNQPLSIINALLSVK